MSTTRSHSGSLLPSYLPTGRQASDLFAQAVARRRPRRAILHEGIYRLERLTFAPSDADDAK